MENGLVMLNRGFKMEVGVQVDGLRLDLLWQHRRNVSGGCLDRQELPLRDTATGVEAYPSVCGNCRVGCNVRWTCASIGSPASIVAPTTPSTRAACATEDAGNTIRQQPGPPAYAAHSQQWAARAGQLGRGAEDGMLPARKIPSSRWPTPSAASARPIPPTKKRTSSRSCCAVLGTHNVDHYHGRFPAVERNGLPWVWTDSIAGLEKAGVIVLWGPTRTRRQPMIDLAYSPRHPQRDARLCCHAGNQRGSTGWRTARSATPPGRPGTVARALLSVVLSEQLTRGDFATKRAASVKALRIFAGWRRTSQTLARYGWRGHQDVARAGTRNRPGQWRSAAL